MAKVDVNLWSTNGFDWATVLDWNTFKVLPTQYSSPLKMHMEDHAPLPPAFPENVFARVAGANE